MNLTIDKDLAIFFLGSGTLVVGIATFIVAMSQMKIASAKNKIELYNKRFAIYVATLDYCNALWYESNTSAREKSNAQTKGCRESVFLFKMKHGVYDTLQKIQEKGASARHYQDEIEKLEAAGSTCRSLTSYRGKRTAVLGEMTPILETLEKQLERYLRFKAASGWNLLW